MKVRELIEALSDFDGDMEVVMSHDYGDRIHTTVCPSIDEVEEGRVVHSDYHRQNKLLDEEDIRHENAKKVVVLR